MGTPTPILIDSKALDDMVRKPGATARTRYFDRETQLIKHATIMLMVRVFLVKTDEMVADIFTKPADRETFYKMRAELMNLEHGTSMHVYGKLARAYAHIQRARRAIVSRF